MGGRGSGSNMNAASSGGNGFNRTTSERSVAINLNNGNWESAERALNRAGAGSEVSVGNDTYTKGNGSTWRGTNSAGNPASYSASQVAQQVASATYDGRLKAKVRFTT